MPTKSASRWFQSYMNMQAYVFREGPIHCMPSKYLSKLKIWKKIELDLRSVYENHKLLCCQKCNLVFGIIYQHFYMYVYLWVFILMISEHCNM